MFRTILITIYLTVMLTACESSNKVSSVSGKNDSGFSQYLKLKNIPKTDKKRVEREEKNYKQREKLAELALKQGVLDAERLNVEVNEYRKQLAISRYFEKFLKEKVNDEAVRNYYANNAEKYEAKKIHIAHVLIRTNPKMSKEERQALLTKAHEVYSRANSNEDFATLVKTYSDDKLSAKKGGDLGWIKEGAIDATFSNKVFTMKKGDISEPISTPYGFHIVKTLDAAKVIKQPFEVVKGNIRYELRQLAKQAETKRLLTLAGDEE